MAATPRIPVLAVVGPTATGKSRLAVELALRLHGEVISADSMQVYEGMEIGTAKPTIAEQRGVPHHLLGVASPAKPFSVASYVALAAESIAELHSRGVLPVLAGGTGLYLRSLLQNITFAENAANPALRARLEALVRTEGVAPLVAELAALDPESVARLDIKNPVRLIRAIEICHATGGTMTQHLARSRLAPTPYNSCVVGLDFRSREALYERIDRRVEDMLAHGLAEEARAVLALPEGATARQAIGYKEFAPYFAGQITLEDAAARVKQESRRYAKRQRTWFRRDEGVHWLFVDDMNWNDLADEAERLARQAVVQGAVASAWRK